tara:strand:- start:1412 stop:1996 length:585 start_codon:yes stop_codon:yes gene_type:complete
MFLKPEQINNRLKGIQLVYPTLKEEFDQYYNQLEFKDFTDYQRKTLAEEGKGHEIDCNAYMSAPIADTNAKWSVAPLFVNHMPYPNNRKVLPRLMKTMYWLGETVYVGIVRLAGKSELGWHFDPDPGKTTVRYRCNLPLSDTISILSVENESRPLAEGKLLVFKSSALHKVENQGENVRYSLIFDIWREGRGRM